MFDERVRELLEKVGSVPDFCGVNFNSINATNALGDNALHCVCVWGDLAATKLLVEHGIDIHQRGEFGFTPLRVAVDFGYSEIAAFLISSGADPAAIDAPEVFDARANAAHLGNLQAQIESLESCADDANPNEHRP
jgi:ankyrin repeat protein